MKKRILTIGSLIIYPIINTLLEIWLITFLPHSLLTGNQGQLVSPTSTYIIVAGVFVSLVAFQLIWRFGMSKSKILRKLPITNFNSNILNWHVGVNAFGLFSLLMECLIYYHQLASNNFLFQSILLIILGLIYLSTGIFDFIKLWKTNGINYYSLILSLENFVILGLVTSFELSPM